MQHASPQHVPAQFATVHPGFTHEFSQRMLGAEHILLQPPQLCGSFCSFTQLPLQHEKPGPHGGLQLAPVPVVVVTLAFVVVVTVPLVAVVVPFVAVVPVVALVLDVPVVLAAPPAPPVAFVTVLEQPRSAIAPIRNAECVVSEGIGPSEQRIGERPDAPLAAHSMG